MTRVAPPRLALMLLWWSPLIKFFNSIQLSVKKTTKPTMNNQARNKIDLPKKIHMFVFTHGSVYMLQTGKNRGRLMTFSYRLDVAYRFYRYRSRLYKLVNIFHCSKSQQVFSNPLTCRVH